ncbi:MAG: ketoacyl-ACP synthase III [Bacteriovoracaceae bacterium]|nr:ketoacyl-ACP synthase III [Bacteriovoracaceae bacterium]
MTSGSLYRAKFLGTGRYHPQKVMTNDDLSKIVETSHDWIFPRTGIAERRISDPHQAEFPSDMALYATQKALKQAGLVADDIDMILFATVTPDVHLPNTACILQVKLGMTKNCACLDIAAACSGFVYGVNMATALIETGVMKNILVIGSEMLSTVNNWSDRNTCILFGDGCGVAILGRAQADDKSEILAMTLGADGKGREFFDKEVGGAIRPITKEILESNQNYMRMQGKDMFKVAVKTLTENVMTCLKEANLTLNDLDWLVPHQANLRIIEATGERLGIDPKKVIVNIEKFGNTSAATVPTAFDQAIEEGKIKRGDLVCFTAFGAGLTFGATLFRY